MNVDLCKHDSNNHGYARNPDWKRAHEELSRLARWRAGLDWEQGRWLLRAIRLGTHLHLGFGRFGEYIERLFGYSRRTTEDRLRVAEALERLPALDDALRDGTTSWSIARELTRVATAENEHAWLDVARGHTVREVEVAASWSRWGTRSYRWRNATHSTSVESTAPAPTWARQLGPDKKCHRVCGGS